jgi:hypothetical protein
MGSGSAMCLFFPFLYLFNPRQIHCSSCKTTDIMLMTLASQDYDRELATNSKYANGLYAGD